jgi:hypothetical protein
MNLAFLARATALVVAGTCITATAEDAAPTSGSTSVEQIVACTQRNIVDLTAVRYVEAQTVDASGKTQRLKLELLWKPGKTRLDHRMNLKVVEPPELAESAFLLVHEQGVELVFFFLPAAKKALFLKGQEQWRPLWGTDFSYGELKQVMGVLETGNARRLGDAAVDGRPVWILETVSSDADAQYDKVVSFIDRENCVMLRSEFHARGTVRKELKADPASVRKSGAGAVALVYTMRDLAQGSSTRLSLSDYIPTQVPDAMFQPDSFAGQQQQ